MSFFLARKMPDFHALVGHYKLVKHPDLVKHL